MNERLKQQLDFILEIDKEKNILRQTHLSGHGRRENDAEHAWHMAIMAYLLKDYANEPVDIAKVMIMCLIHDIVEIDAGDTYAYDTEGLKTQKAREDAAKERIFSLLPEDQKKELEEIFIRTYGKVERKGGLTPKTYESEYAKKQRKKEEAMQEYLLVDGYNVIFAWQELKELAKVSIEAARDKLMDILCNYQGYKKCVLILVFDAYKVEGYALEIQKYHNIHVVYTKEAETADQYIEKVVHHIGRKYHVTVVTSDGVEQVITMGQGGTRISSRDFLEEIEYTKKLIEEDNEKQRVSDRNYLFDHADEEFVKKMEKIRLGKETE